MKSLDGRTIGLYTVTTRLANHCVDLDLVPLARAADEPDIHIRCLDRANVVVRLLDHLRCQIGERLTPDLDPDLLGARSTRRATAPIIGIHPLTNADGERETLS